MKQSILEVTGNTPLVALHRLSEGTGSLIAVKCESWNAGNSVKDRIALRIIEDAEREGLLKPGDQVIERTSGNTGIGCAIVCAVKGYRFTAVMSEGNSMERRKTLKAYGAELELVPQVTGKPGMVTHEDWLAVEERSRVMAEESGAFMVDQFNRAGNPNTHYDNTGQEIWTQSEGKVTHWVANLGTGGTFMGVAKALKEKNADVQCICAEPNSAAFLAGKEVTNTSHKLQGTGYALTPPPWNKELVDDFIQVTDEEAVSAGRRLAKEEGILGGFSSGGNVAAALKVAANAPAGSLIVTPVCDTGLRYLSTDLFE